MTATKALGTYGNGAGVVTPLDHKMAQITQWVKTTTLNLIRPGVLYNGTSTLVAGKANMSFDVSAFSAVLTRSATAGVVELTNDGTYNATTTAAPGSNSRIDLIILWAREFSLDGSDSTPVITVVQGTAAASPTAPSLAAYPGAIELARATIPAGITATTSATITQTAPFTSADGGIVVFRTTTEMNLWTTALTNQRAEDLSTHIIYRWNGSAWKAWESEWIDYSGTVTVTNWVSGSGTGAAKTFSYRYVNGRVRVKWYLGFGTTGASVTTSFVTFTLPVAASTPPHSEFNYPGTAEIWDNSPAVLRVNCGVVSNGTSTTVVRIYTTTLSGNGYDFVAPAVPITWAVSDAVHGEFEYDPA